jgi:UDP-N-acetylglucosamine:LPS N-acetylglucosamine transferase
VTKVLIPIHGGGWGYQLGEIVKMLGDNIEFCYMLQMDGQRPTHAGFPPGAYFVAPRFQNMGSGSILTSLRAALGTFIRTLAFMRRERPDVAIGLGSPASVFMLLAGRLMGCETIYIESITRVKTPSRALKVCRTLAAAKHIFVQWQELADVLPGTRYDGNVI